MNYAGQLSSYESRALWPNEIKKVPSMRGGETGIDHLPVWGCALDENACNAIVKHLSHHLAFSERR